MPADFGYFQSNLIQYLLDRASLYQKLSTGGGVATPSPQDAQMWAQRAQDALRLLERAREVTPSGYAQLAQEVNATLTPGGSPTSYIVHSLGTPNPLTNAEILAEGGAPAVETGAGAAAETGAGAAAETGTTAVEQSFWRRLLSRLGLSAAEGAGVSIATVATGVGIGIVVIGVAGAIYVYTADKPIQPGPQMLNRPTPANVNPPAESPPPATPAQPPAPAEVVPPEQPPPPPQEVAPPPANALPPPVQGENPQPPAVNPAAPSPPTQNAPTPTCCPGSQTRSIRLFNVTPNPCPPC